MRRKEKKKNAVYIYEIVCPPQHFSRNYSDNTVDNNVWSISRYLRAKRSESIISVPVFIVVLVLIFCGWSASAFTSSSSSPSCTSDSRLRLPVLGEGRLCGAWVGRTDRIGACRYNSRQNGRDISRHNRRYNSRYNTRENSRYNSRHNSWYNSRAK